MDLTFVSTANPMVTFLRLARNKSWGSKADPDRAAAVYSNSDLQQEVSSTCANQKMRKLSNGEFRGCTFLNKH